MTTGSPMEGLCVFENLFPYNKRIEANKHFENAPSKSAHVLTRPRRQVLYQK